MGIYSRLPSGRDNSYPKPLSFIPFCSFYNLSFDWDFTTKLTESGGGIAAVVVLEFGTLKIWAPKTFYIQDCLHHNSLRIGATADDVVVFFDAHLMLLIIILKDKWNSSLVVRMEGDNSLEYAEGNIKRRSSLQIE